MKLRFLGTGTSTGVPEIGCKCEVCTSTDPRDRRLRCSALLEAGEVNMLIDCGPDFREQMLRADVKKIDALLLTITVPSLTVTKSWESSHVPSRTKDY